jgi:hypothetical protein
VPLAVYDSTSGLTMLSTRPAEAAGWSWKKAVTHRRDRRRFASRPLAVIGMYLRAPVVPLVIVNSTGGSRVSW